MKIRTRLILAFLILVTLGFLAFVNWVMDDLCPRYQATMEESMVDTATLLSALLEQQIESGVIKVDPLRECLRRAQDKRFAAKIYEVTKEHLDLRVYVTDCNGTVLYDSNQGRDEGKNYLKWLDVALTLRGQYGARATPLVRGDRATSILYVGAPIRSKGQIIGVLTVGKPAESVARFMLGTRRKIIGTGLVAGLAIVLLGGVITSWITIPIAKLTQYAQAVRDGRRVELPHLGRNEIGQLGAAFDEMRDALEGKEYIDQYVQTLTHEMKSPLSAIRGAAELLEEEMAPEPRRRFLENIRAESGRMQDLIDRLLQLAALEKRKGLRDVEVVDLGALLRGLVKSLAPVCSAKGLTVELEEAGNWTAKVKGEPFLLRLTLSNILQNAIDFSPQNGAITLALQASDGAAQITVSDQGPGIPDYALAKVFDRFYSLTRPDSGKKSSGLGLTIAREVVSLHGGAIALDNAPTGGARATLRLPINPS